VKRPDGKRPLGKPRLREDNNTNIDLQEVGGGGMEWIDMVQDKNRWRAVVNAELNLGVP
jgi:hypothetical protein